MGHQHQHPGGLSVLQAARLFKRDRGTIEGWIARGCPVLRRADRSRGLSWLIDPAAVLAWREEQAASNAVPTRGDLPPLPGEDEPREERLSLEEGMVKTHLGVALQILDRATGPLLLALRDQDLSVSKIARVVALVHGLYGLFAAKWAGMDADVSLPTLFMIEVVDEGSDADAVERVVRRRFAEIDAPRRRRGGKEEEPC